MLPETTMTVTMRPALRGLLLLLSGAVATAAGISPPPPDDGPRLLFHVSFDKDRRAEHAVGPDLPVQARYARENRTAEGGNHVDGVFGKALMGPCARYGSGDYDALGNFLAERGTIAFFVRQEGMHYGFEPLVINTVDSYYWGMYTRLSNKDNSLSAWFPNEMYRPIVVGAGRKATLADGRWHHIAVAWDQAYGTCYYFDGALAGTNWGKASWTSRGVDPDRIALVYTDGVAYDELYVFDRPLSAAQVQRLQKTNVAPAASELSPVPFDDRRKANRLAELGWPTDGDALPPGMPKIVLGRSGLGGNSVRQVVPLDARCVKKDGGEATDGKLGQGWPPTYNYEYAKGNGLHVQTGEPFDLAVIEGHFRGLVFGQKQLLPEGEPVTRIASSGFKHRWALDAPRGAGWLSFFKAVAEDQGDLPDKELAAQSRICELSFFRRGAHALRGAATMRRFLNAASVEEGARLLGAELTGRYAQGDRAALPLRSSAPAQPGGQRVPGLRFHHLVVPPLGKESALLGLRLTLCLQGSADGNALYVEMRDPSLPGRRLFGLDFAIAGGEAARPQILDLTLDTADRLLPPDKPLWITFCFRQDVDLLWPDAQRASALELLTGRREDAAPEYLRAELAFVKSRFRELSEARPWGAHKEPEKEMPEFNRSARELFVPLAQLWKAMPDDPKVRAIWLWTHKHHQDTSPVEPLAVPGAEDAPRWALLQRELLQRSRDIFSWWIENRQTPNGEFGDAWGDDTDLTQNLPALVLMGDPGARLAKAAAAVADGVYLSGLIQRGINRRVMDTLHAYEEGVNVQPAMGLIDYGNPKYHERMMEAARTVATELTRRDSVGRLRFRSAWFGAEGIQDKGKYGVDHPGNALFCHPALFLSFYGRHPAAVKFLQDWIDGWLDIYAETAKKDGAAQVPSGTLLDGRVVRWDSKVRGYGYVDCYAALHAITGDPKYASLTPYWTGRKGARGGFLLGGNYLAALEMIDWKQWREEILAWADTADLSHPGDDGMGQEARRRLARWEAAGDEKAAVEALEACVRKLRLTFEAHTWAEPINDRIWAPDHPLIVMAQGEMSHERNQIWPRHYVSYSGLSELAAWVRKKSNTSLRVWIYSFAPHAEQGSVRVWRTPLGRYRVRFGPDANADEQVDSGEATTRTLHHAADIPLRVPPRQLCLLEIDLLQRSAEDFWKRPDLGLSADDVKIEGGKVEITVHNLGNSPADAVDVALVDATGRVLANKSAPTIEAPLDLKPRAATVTFDRLPPGAVEVRIDPSDHVLELNELNNAARLN